jgi:predicted P-loop ATPase
VAIDANADAPTSRRKRHAVARYYYNDAGGQAYIRVSKWSTGNRFSRSHWDGSRWRSGTGGLTPVLYKLPELRATAGHKTVFIAEGEKDVDNLMALGLLATCNIGGTGRWRNAYNRELVGAHVVILADNDQAGRDHAAYVAGSLHPHAASVRVVEFAELPEKGDVSDWIAWRREAGDDDEAIGDALRRRARQTDYWSPPAAADPRGDWYSRTIANKDGTPKSNLANVLLALTEDPAWRGVLAFDEMNRTAYLQRPVPEHRNAAPANVTPRPITDEDVTAAQHWLQLAGLPSVSKDIVHQAVDKVARDNAHHPVRDYLTGLRWDGTPRLDTWLAHYLGADRSDYAGRVGRMFLIGMVARVMKPGCKVDHMLVLEGEQGTMKSAACRVLGGEHFDDNLPTDLNGKDAKQYLRGKWLIEVAEMHAFSKAEAAQLKAFITRQVETYRPSYGRREVHEPRQCVFIGTTNKKAYLRDETGGRRFWPIKVRSIDIDALKHDRDQLFAEAVAAFNADEYWWPDKDFEAAHIVPEQEQRFEVDAWETMIEEWLSAREAHDQASGNQTRFTVGDVAIGALNFEKSRIGKRDQRRITPILERLGWQRGERGTGGAKLWERATE